MRVPPNTSRPRPTTRAAFSLIDLLVVIGVVGMLLALLFPAVQASREAMRRASCANNLKQLGLAIHEFHGAKGALPRGAIVQSMPDYGPLVEAGGSLLIFLLPYIDQQSLYQNYDLTKTDATSTVYPYVDVQTFSGTTTQLRTAEISTYLCPSDVPPPNPVMAGGLPVGLFNYAGSSGSRAPSATGNVDPAGPCPCAQTFTSPFAPSPASIGFGPFQRYHYLPPATPVTTPINRLNSVTDGLSKTIFMGETRPSCSTFVASGWGSSGNINGLATTMVSLNADTCQADAPDPCNQPCNNNLSLGFKSAHPGGVQFLMGDGSVRFLDEDIDFLTLQYLGGQADGNPVTVPD